MSDKVSRKRKHNSYVGEKSGNDGISYEKTKGENEGKKKKKKGNEYDALGVGNLFKETFPEEGRSAPPRDYHHYAKSHLEQDKLSRYEKQGSRWCAEEGGRCILFKKVKKENNHSTIRGEVWKNICYQDDVTICVCQGECKSRCRRYASYKLMSFILKLQSRQPLPICVRYYIESLYGESTTGYTKAEL